MKWKNQLILGRDFGKIKILKSFASCTRKIETKLQQTRMDVMLSTV